MKATLLLLVPIALGACRTDSSPYESRLGVDLAATDTTVRPQDDLFRFVNGTWLKNTEIPADKSRIGSFIDLRDSSEKHVHTIITELAERNDLEEGSDERKVADMYRSFMDSARVAVAGSQPLDAELARVDAIDSIEELARYMARAEAVGIGDPLTFFVDVDRKNVSQYIMYFGQSGLVLPDRDYYLSESFAEIRDKYREHIKTMFGLAGRPDGATAATTIVGIETRFAESHWTRARSRDRNATYNKYSVDGASTFMPNFPWRTYLDAVGGQEADSIIIRQPDFFTAFDQSLVDVPLDDWKTYFRFRVILRAAPYLTDDFVDADFDFSGRALSGQRENRPRWKRAVTATNSGLGDIVGQVYVDRYFPPEAKERMDELVSNLIRAFDSGIDELDWMSDATKARAKEKLSKFTVKIGYPADWKDYSDVEIKVDDLLGNILRTTAAEHFRDMAKIGGPIDRDEWFMTPQTVNAYYNAEMNEVVFPAAILRPPFFNVHADDAVNYGGIGAVIGHEISHGFDDQGRKSDGDGRLHDWWTEEDAAEFTSRAEALVQQYNEYSPVDGMHVNGELTLGENIGDLSGLTIAHRAYKLSQKKSPAPTLAGFSPDQRFFVGFGQIWRMKQTDELTRRRLVSDSHSPAEFRCNGVVKNMPEFADAFAVSEGDGLYIPPDERVKIW